MLLVDLAVHGAEQPQPRGAPTAAALQVCVCVHSSVCSGTHSTVLIWGHSSRMLLAACFPHLHRDLGAAEHRALGVGAMLDSSSPYFRPAFLQKLFLSHPTVLHG